LRIAARARFDQRAQIIKQARIRLAQRLTTAARPPGYFTDAGLRALIRDPRSVRIWLEQRMPGFAEENLSDEELGLILAYLSHTADRKSRATEGGSSKR
jgi:hypothetical protein